MQIKNVLKSLGVILGITMMICSCSNTHVTDSSSHELNPDDFNTILEKSQVGTYNSYTYEYWNQEDIGDAVMGLRDDGSFAVEWNGIFNMLARNGVRPGQDVTSVTYKVEDYEVTGGISYLCVYGWFYNGSNYDDLVEYYIVENWKNWNPATNATPHGSITVDGDTYYLYTSKRVNKPSIKGTATFTQYWSIRQSSDLRTSGTINVQAHFQAWENAGLTIGETMHEVSFCVEGYGGSNTGYGRADVTELSFNTR
ncbi:MAG: glycoside hydrolase family 11 protein [Bacteroidota bacterium]